MGASVELPMGPRSAVLSGWKCEFAHGGRMRAVPLRASVELPMGPRNAVLAVSYTHLRAHETGAYL
eukprot:3841642-Pyramimonas_sp.AAC.1